MKSESWIALQILGESLKCTSPFGHAQSLFIQKTVTVHELLAQSHYEAKILNKGGELLLQISCPLHGLFGGYNVH
ncbi:hypothetical protein B6A42_20475 [Vibrio coralliilyticus]|nr:hypothetical protein B6A42_20475 [Vibrio coralliilyticus]